MHFVGNLKQFKTISILASKKTGYFTV